MFKDLKRLIATVLFCLATGNVAAQHLHDGDIEMAVDGGQLVVLGAEHAEYGTGRAIFEGSLDTLLAGPRYRTTSPGFDSEPGTFGTSEVISFVGWGTLAFWDGVAWADMVPNGEKVIVRDSLDETLTFAVDGLTPSGGFTGLIDEGGATGQIHQHVAFTLETDPLQMPATGAYRIGLQLTSSVNDASDEFYLVLNRGMDSEAFEGAIHVMAVPEPETYGLFAAGLLVLAAGVRRRKMA